MLNFRTHRILFPLLLVVFIGIIYFPIFLRLDSKSLREWDEARNAVNAFEMNQTNNFLVKTFNYAPDLWETKPPLLIWLQTIGFKIFGVTELAVRLPSALATFCLLLFLLNFFNRTFKAPELGIFASLILITSHAYVFEHCTRTGDHDALLICFEILMLFYFYLYIHFKKNKYLTGFAISLLLCMFTKSIACILFFPGLVIYLILSGKFISSLKDKKIWIGFGLALIAILTYYLLREAASSGYLIAVWQNELFPRYFNTSTTYQYNPRDLTFYFKQIYEHQFSEWYILILPAIILNEICSEVQLKKFHRFILIIVFSFFVVISFGTTNHSYSLPLMPLFAIIIGIAFYNIGRLLFERSRMKQKEKILLVILLLLSIFYQPYCTTLEKTIETADSNPQVQYAYVFKRIEKEYPELKQFYVYEPSSSNYPLVFYQKKYNDLKNYNISTINSEQLKTSSGMVVLFEQQMNRLNQKGISYQVLFKEHNCLLIQINK